MIMIMIIMIIIMIIIIIVTPQMYLRNFPRPWHLLPGLLHRQLHRRDNIPDVIMLKRKYAYMA